MDMKVFTASRSTDIKSYINFKQFFSFLIHHQSCLSVNSKQQKMKIKLGFKSSEFISSIFALHFYIFCRLAARILVHRMALALTKKIALAQIQCQNMLYVCAIWLCPILLAVYISNFIMTSLKLTMDLSKFIAWQVHFTKSA